MMINKVNSNKERDLTNDFRGLMVRYVFRRHRHELLCKISGF